ncbi:hypothetical protein MRX96_002298 [Rhipicephalus microplus]
MATYYSLHDDLGNFVYSAGAQRSHDHDVTTTRPFHDHDAPAEPGWVSLSTYGHLPRQNNESSLHVHGVQRRGVKRQEVNSLLIMSPKSGPPRP